MRTHEISFGSVLYISQSDIEVLPEELNCLACILKSADIEVQVEIQAEIEPGYEGDWEEPPSPPMASFVGSDILDFSIAADTNECSKTIEVLMTKEQKKALKEFTDYLIEHKWQSEFEQEALSQEGPSPEDYY